MYRHGEGGEKNLAFHITLCTYCNKRAKRYRLGLQYHSYIFILTHSNAKDLTTYTHVQQKLILGQRQKAWHKAVWAKCYPSNGVFMK